MSRVHQGLPVTPLPMIRPAPPVQAPAPDQDPVAQSVLNSVLNGLLGLNN